MSKDYKIVLSPLASAFLIPGLGQILNGQARKALTLMALVFVQILIFSITFIGTLKSDSNLLAAISSGEVTLMSLLFEKPLLGLIFSTYILTWLYGIIDSAYIAYKRIQRD